MTQRLPIPGSDNGDWGEILNGYLEVSHAADGTLNNNVVGTNQIQNNAVTNAQLDSSIQAAVTKASSSVQTVNSQTPDSSGNVTLSASDVSAISESTADSRYVPQSSLGAPGGVATLTGSTLTLSQLPNSVVDVGSLPNQSGLFLMSSSDSTNSGVWSSSDAPAGPAGLNWRGTYNNATTYAQNDAVQYNGSAYIATAGVTGTLPGTPTNPVSPWNLLVSIGNEGPASTGVEGVVGPSDAGYIAWNADPIFIANYQQPYHGQLYGAAIKLQSGQVTEGVDYDLHAAGATLTAGENFICLFDTFGNLVAQTADLSTAWASAPQLTTAAWEEAFTVVNTGLHYLAYLFNGTTAPEFGCIGPGGGDSSLGNKVFRFGQLDSSQFNLTTPPASVNLANNVKLNQNYWFGLH